MKKRNLFAELRDGFNALAAERKGAASKMKLCPIRTKRKYRATLNEVWALWDAREGTPDAKRLEALLPLVEAYDRRRFPMKMKLRRAARREHG